MTLVVTDPTRCPDCGAHLTQRTEGQPALIRHGGYGADRVTVTAVCPAAGCDWYLTVSISETRPQGARP